MAAEDNLALREAEKHTASILGFEDAMETPLRQACMMHDENDRKGEGVVSAECNVRCMSEGTHYQNDPKGKGDVSIQTNVEDKMDLPAKQPAMVPNPNDLNVNEPPIVSEEGNVNIQNNVVVPKSVQDVVIDALPVSTVIPQDYDYAKYGNPKVKNYDVYMHEVTSHTDLLTKYDRQSNWYIEKKSRKSGIIDKYYTHLLSAVRCRSLKEVYNFVEFGRKSTRQPPQMGDGEEARGMNQQTPTGDNDQANRNDDAIQRGAKRQRGCSLIERMEVGYYLSRSELKTSGGLGYICRRKPSELETIAETPKAIKKGRKRKKVEENAAEDENKGESAASLTPIRIHNIIYDFVPTQVGRQEF